MADAILDVRELRKAFGALAATDGISLEVREGETHAIIGPNGAGKTTLISQLAGNLQPDSGSIRFAGEDVSRARYYPEDDDFLLEKEPEVTHASVLRADLPQQLTIDN